MNKNIISQGTRNDFNPRKKSNSVKIISLGGFGHITQNMFVYETDEDILIVDCGIGFPTEEMLGIDLVVPDVEYLLPRVNKIRGIVLSHGHEDHVGALPYLLPKLPKVPVFGSKWALALAEGKLKEFGKTAHFEQVGPGKKIILGGFSVEFIEVTHSIPETLHLVINTPVGVFYHAADFKLDLSPVVGKPTDQKQIGAVGKRGVLCLLSDCLRAEKEGFTPPEARLKETFEREIADCRGQFIVTMMSSNVSRLKQAIEASVQANRKVVLVGRSIEKNAQLAIKLGYLKFPRDTFLPLREARKHPASSLALVVAGSQAQAGSALERIVAGEREVKIGKGDKVVFSSDYIPGNELAIYALIDDILRLGADVSYADVSGDLHVSGHGRGEDLKKLINLIKPQHFLPIGGNLRHMVAYQKLATRLGYKKEATILPENGQSIEFFADGRVGFGKTVKTRTIMVDALGVGDVGNVVLRDRRVLAEEGIVVAIVSVDQNDLSLVGQPDIITRGFVYVKESKELIGGAKKEIRKVVSKQHSRDVRFLRGSLNEVLEKFFLQKTGRRPMVLSVVLEV